MHCLIASYKDNINLSGVPFSLSDSNDGGASVEWVFRANGTGEAYAGGSLVSIWVWCSPTATSYTDNYEILFNFGTNTTPDPGQVWNPLTVDRSFGDSLSALSGSSSGNFVFFIRRIGSELILATASVLYNLDSGA